MVIYCLISPSSIDKNGKIVKPDVMTGFKLRYLHDEDEVGGRIGKFMVCKLIDKSETNNKFVNYFRKMAFAMYFLIECMV